MHLSIVLLLSSNYYYCYTTLTHPFHAECLKWKLILVISRLTNHCLLTENICLRILCFEAKNCVDYFPDKFQVGRHAKCVYIFALSGLMTANWLGVINLCLIRMN